MTTAKKAAAKRTSPKKVAMKKVAAKKATTKKPARRAITKAVAKQALDHKARAVKKAAAKKAATRRRPVPPSMIPVPILRATIPPPAPTLPSQRPSSYQPEPVIAKTSRRVSELIRQKIMNGVTQVIITDIADLNWLLKKFPNLGIKVSPNANYDYLTAQTKVRAKDTMQVFNGPSGPKLCDISSVLVYTNLQAMNEEVLCIRKVHSGFAGPSKKSLWAFGKHSPLHGYGRRGFNRGLLPTINPKTLEVGRYVTVREFEGDFEAIITEVIDTDLSIIRTVKRGRNKVMVSDTTFDTRSIAEIHQRVDLD